ncbi:hypothetical protein Hs30E_20120 [Lactococcus hodotermopsidis]|uniref:Uncharacterized protein n=1 Tax=Pseudolactococcus hodotermopsidis TaxID=2709157 RepID=A0A6A0BGR3_9LACT|nr:hypothetical protein Hs30E_20120 [Lactococcus hodotermopsidis]
MAEKGKSVNALMKHIRGEHHIDSYGSRNKQDLLNMGYFHAYKAYKFIRLVPKPYKKC